MTRWSRSAGGSSRLVVALGAVVLLAACGSAEVPTPAASTQPKGAPAIALEKPNLRVGVLPIVDAAAVQLAKSAGYFTTEGLDVELVPIQGGAVAIPKLATGELDLSWTNWPSAISAQANGTSSLRLLPEGYSTAPGSFQIMTAPGSPIRSPKDLVGKTVAVNTIRSITDLLARSALLSAGVDASTVKFTELPFPDMPNALKWGQIDAAVMVEPFITLTENQFGAVSLLDVTGAEATNNLSFSGLASTAQWAQQNPNTLAAFERAVRLAQSAMANRRVIEQVLPTYTSIRPETLPQLSLGIWPTTLTTKQLQRVSDLMQQFGVLDDYFDVGPMLEPAG
jgi:NitT/TauT family transport system substrate-binding protein